MRLASSAVGIENRSDIRVCKAIRWILQRAAVEGEQELQAVQDLRGGGGQVAARQEASICASCLASLLRNIDQPMGICNGTKVVIKELADNLITVEVLTGKAKGATLELPRFVLLSVEKQGLRFTRHQFPIRLAFSSSIHKAQGQSARTYRRIHTHSLVTHSLTPF